MSSGSADTPSPATSSSTDTAHPANPGRAEAEPTPENVTRSTSHSPARHSPAPWPLFLVVDLVLVVLFAGIGRVSHGEDLAGAFITAWPFLAGALIGWIVSRGSRSPAALWPTGVIVWLSAEVEGMLLRAVTGQGTALSFVIVSLVVLGVFLLGYRLLVAAVRRVRSR